MGKPKIVTWLENNKSVLEVASTCVIGIIGIATLIVSIVNARFVSQQTEINKALSQLQMEQAQPYFVITFELEKDSEDDIFGTERMVIKNLGFRNVSPIVQKNVFFELTRSYNTQMDTILVKVDDYFCVSSSNHSGEELVYRSFDVGNNRRFAEIYWDALQDREHGSLYFLNKIVLVRIDYTDLLNAQHTKYYIDRNEVPEEHFNKTLSKSNPESFCLKDLSYAKMKELLEQQTKE